MKLDLHFERVQGRLRTGVQNARHRWRTRSGLRIRLRDARGFEGWGEASPLLGYSPDTLQQAEQWLTQHGARCAALGLDLLRMHEPEAPPSARFGLETALVNLEAARQGSTVCALLGRVFGGAPSATVRVSAMISALDLPSVRAQTRLLVGQGTMDIKVKVGRPNAFEAECEVLDAVRNLLPLQGSLRVDANQAWSADVLESRLHALSARGVGWAEEPAGLDALEALKETPVPLLLDESLRGPEGVQRGLRLAARGLVGGFVLKPAVLGGFSATLELAAQARDAGLGVSLSHLLDGGLAHGAYGALALLSGHEGPHGLAAHAGLEALGVRGAWPVRGGALRLAEAPVAEGGQVAVDRL